MKEEKMTPVNKNSWTNPSMGVSVSNENISNQVNENIKEINELKNEVKELKEEISKLTNNEIIETPVSPEVEPVKEEKVDMPFESPFTEAVVEDNTSDEEVANTVKDILSKVNEEVKVEETPSNDVPSFDDILADEDKERVSVVINRYNNDIEATTKGKGAKFITLSETEHSKLKSGKINE